MEQEQKYLDKLFEQIKWAVNNGYDLKTHVENERVDCSSGTDGIKFAIQKIKSITINVRAY